MITDRMIDDLAAEAKEFNECHSAAYAIGQGIDRMVLKLKAARKLQPIDWVAIADDVLRGAGHEEADIATYRLGLALALKETAKEYLLVDCPATVLSNDIPY